MARTPGGGPKARALGAELREARNAAGVGVRELARRLHTNHVKVSRYETGMRAPSTEDVAAYLSALGVSEAERKRLVEMARDVHEPDWLASGMPSVHRQAMTLVEFERTASHIVDVAPLLIPGLLQTGDYARAIMDVMPAGEAEARVAMRVSRREVLTKRKPVALSAFVSEHVLREPVGGKAVMVDQLRHILKLCELPNVTVNVVPAGLAKWHLVREGPFLLFEFPKAAPIVNLEHYRSPVFLYEATVVADYLEAVANLRTVAISEQASVKLMEKIARELEEAV